MANKRPFGDGSDAHHARPAQTCLHHYCSFLLCQPYIPIDGAKPLKRRSVLCDNEAGPDARINTLLRGLRRRYYKTHESVARKVCSTILQYLNFLGHLFSNLMLEPLLDRSGCLPSPRILSLPCHIQSPGLTIKRKQSLGSS
jgi:hypothetical protein